MRRIFVAAIAVAASAWSPIALAEDWQQVYADDGGRMYVDAASVKVVGNFVWSWMKTNYATEHVSEYAPEGRTELRYNSRLALATHDCDKRSMRLVSVAEYRRTDLGGEMEAMYNLPQQFGFGEVKPVGIGAAWVDYACSRAAAKR
jgi:hypothetical protein